MVYHSRSYLYWNGCIHQIQQPILKLRIRIQRPIPKLRIWIEKKSEENLLTFSE